MREARAITLLGKQRPEKPLVEPEVQRRWQPQAYRAHSSWQHVAQDLVALAVREAGDVLANRASRATRLRCPTRRSAYGTSCRRPVRTS